ncbi:MAG: ATP-binding protein [Nanobdellota archaeon]
MTKSVAVLSGKGGVGKSSISASLAVLIKKEKDIVCADCDVDASNLSLLFSLETKDYSEWEPLSTNKKAQINPKECNNCKRCIDACYFDAIGVKESKPEIKETGCEGCGACQLVCPKNAIELKKIDNAHIGLSQTKQGIKICSAQLNPGSSGSGKVVSKVKEKALASQKSPELMLIDSAAGIGCPVIASITGSDYALIVTEPSPSGFSDMKRALEIVEHFNINKGIIINKADINKEYSSKIEEFALENNIEIIEKIPFDKEFVQSMVKMTPLVELKKEYEKTFQKIKDKVFLKIYS